MFDQKNIIKYIIQEVINILMIILVKKIEKCFTTMLFRLQVFNELVIKMIPNI